MISELKHCLELWICGISMIMLVLPVSCYSQTEQPILNFSDCKAISGKESYEAGIDCLKKYKEKAYELWSNENKAAWHYEVGSLYKQIDQGKKADWHLLSGLTLLKDQFPDRQSVLLSDLLLRRGELVLTLKGDVNTTILFFQGAFQASPIDTKKGKIQRTKVLLQIAILEGNQGKYHEALNKLNMVLAERINLLGPQDNLVANVYSELGVLYAGALDFKQAQMQFERAAEIRVSCADTLSYRYAQILNNLAAMQEKNGDIFGARTRYKVALDLKRELVGDSAIETSEGYLNYGMNWSYTEDWDSVDKYMQLSLTIDRILYPPTHPELAQTLIGFGYVYETHKRWEAALVAYQQAMEVLVPGFDGTTLSSQPDLGESGDANKLWTCLYSKAENLYYLAWDNGLDLETLKLSHETWKLVAQHIEQLQSGFQDDDTRFMVGEWAHGDLEKAIKGAVLLADLTGDSRYLWEGLHFAELGRGVLLRDGVNRMAVEAFSGIQGDLIREERQLAQELRSQKVEVDLLAPGSSSYADIQLMESYQSLRLRYEQLLLQIQRKAPRYHELRYQSIALNWSQLQKSMETEESLWVEYFYGESCITAFYLTEQGISSFQIANDTAFRAHLNDFQTMCALPPEDENWNEQMRQLETESKWLYKRLLLPVEEQLGSRFSDFRTLYIVPDGPLGKLPFHALGVENTSESVSTFRYLAEFIPIGYAFSIHHQFAIQSSPYVEKESGGLLAYILTDEIMAEDGKTILPALTGARREKSALESWEGAEIIPGDEMTEIHFKDNAKNARQIHLSTHAQAGEEGDSRLYFSSGGNPEEDGILWASEVYGMNLSAELLVLSACQTGEGTYQSGAGVLSLGHAFAYAGVRNQVVSLWALDDGSGADLMEGFYASRSNGVEVVKALNFAEVNYLKNHGKRGRHPFYWGGYVAM